MKIDLYQFLLDAFDSLEEPVKLQFIEDVSCSDSVIKHVADQIFKGFTDSGSRGSKLCTATAKPTHGLDYALRLFAKHVAVEEIKRLEEALMYRQKEIDNLQARNRRYE